jgi:hypothetical protein
MGCNSSLSYQNQFTIGPGDVKPLRVDAPRREQQVTVTFTSSAAPVDVYLALDKDLDNALIAIENYKKPEGILAKLEKSSNGSLQAVIPAKTAFGVIVAGSIRDTSVEVKITSK